MWTNLQYFFVQTHGDLIMLVLSLYLAAVMLISILILAAWAARRLKP